MPRNDIILFLDLETTGTDESLDSIIEVGIAVYTWPAFDEVFAKSYIAMPTDEAFARMQGTDVVREMHKSNGLLSEIEALKNQDPLGLPYPSDVDKRIDEDLSRFGTRNSPHIPLAGSGVSHFDRKFIKRNLPILDSRLTHWAYDVGVLRRMFILVGAKPAPDDAKTHRALDDARVHATEFKFYTERISEMFGALRAEADAAKSS